MSVEHIAVLGYGYIIPYWYYRSLCSLNEADLVSQLEDFSIRLYEWSNYDEDPVFVGVCLASSEDYYIVHHQVGEYEKAMVEDLDSNFQLSSNSLNNIAEPKTYLLLECW